MICAIESSNLQEYAAATDPGDPRSRLQVSGVAGTDGSFALMLDGRAGRTYRLQRFLPGPDASWTVIATEGPLGEDATVTLNDSPVAAPTVFYRVQVFAP